MSHVAHEMNTTAFKTRPMAYITRLSFWLLAAIVLLNLNGVARMGFGMSRAFSLAILLLCICLILANWPRVLSASGKVGQMIMVLILAYLLVGSASFIANGSTSPGMVLGILVSYFSTIVIFIAASSTTRRFISRDNTRTLIIGLYILMLIATLSVFFSPLIRSLYILPPTTGAFRLNGVFGNPNETGSYACMVFVFSLGVMHMRDLRALGIAGATISSIATVLTFSKTAIIILLILFGMALFSAKGKKGSRSIIIAVVSALSIGAAVLLVFGADKLDLHSAQVQRVSQVLEFLQTGRFGDSAVASRSDIWRLSAEKVMDSPVIGNGLGALHELDNAPVSTQGTRLGAHNQYLVFAGESGLLVGALFVFVLFFAVAAALRCKHPFVRTVSLGYFIVFALGNVTSHNLFTMRFHALLLGVISALLAAYSRPGAAVTYTNVADNPSLSEASSI